MMTIPSIPYAGAYTWATRPASARNGDVALMTDVGDTGGTYMRWNGTYWRVIAPTDLYFSVATVTGDTTGNDQVLKSTGLLPAGLLRCGRYFKVHGSIGKNGAVDAASFNRIRIGTANSVADTTLVALTAMAASARSYAHEFVFAAASATSLALISAQNLTTTPYPNATTTTVYGTATTISDLDANALAIHQDIDLAGTTDAPQGFVLGVRMYP